MYWGEKGNKKQYDGGHERVLAMLHLGQIVFQVLMSSDLEPYCSIDVDVYLISICLSFSDQAKKNYKYSEY